MAAVTRVGEIGNQLRVTFDDGTDVTLFKAGSFWLPGGDHQTPDPADTPDDPDAPDPGPDPDAPAPILTTPVKEHPKKPPTHSNDPDPTPGAYNPWKHLTPTGSWQDHMSYSLGGIDYGLNYGTGIKAPAAGRLTSRAQGGFADTGTGWVGSAGRRSILWLDDPIPRKPDHPIQQKEGSGAMVAIVFQHQSVMGKDRKHYDRGQILGKSGASAYHKDYGGDIHLHVHGLNASGRRLNILNYLP